MRWLFLLFCFMPNAFLAQQRSSGYVFKAGELMHVAQRLVGDSTAWQIVVASAERRTSTNEFLLSATAQKNLRTFSTLREKVNRERSTLSRLVKRGAPILAEVGDGKYCIVGICMQFHFNRAIFATVFDGVSHEVLNRFHHQVFGSVNGGE